MRHNIFAISLFFYACQNPTTPIDQAPVPRVNTQSPDTSFNSFWNSFIGTVQNTSIQELNGLLLDSLDCQGKAISASDFLSHYYPKVFTDSVKIDLSDSLRIRFIDSQMYYSGLMPCAKKLIDSSEIVDFKKVNVTKEFFVVDSPDLLVLMFIKTKNGFKFYGYTSTSKILPAK